MSVRGSLLVIPSGKALLYAEPIYLQAQQSPMPELRLVVLALQDKLAYGPTFESALASLFGGETSSLSATNPRQPRRSLLQPPRYQRPQAATRPERADRRGRQGLRRLPAPHRRGQTGEAGQKLDQLKIVLNRLNRIKNSHHICTHKACNGRLPGALVAYLRLGSLLLPLPCPYGGDRGFSPLE